MKQLLKVLSVFFLITVILSVTDQVSASTGKEKVYREYSLPKETNKFPIKLTNGLTVATTKANGKTVPVIKKGSKVVWQGVAIATNSKIRFSVTKNQDTFFTYSQTVSGETTVVLIGVNKNGTILSTQHMEYADLIKLDFISDSLLEVGFNSGDFENFPDYISRFYQLYKNGDVREVNYFDSSFISALKKGQLKWTKGAIGTTYKNLKPAVVNYDGKESIDTVFTGIESYYTWKVSYRFSQGKKPFKFEPDQKVEFIEGRYIAVNQATLKATLKSHLGAPVKNEYTYSDREIYSAGNYYLLVYYGKSNVVGLTLFAKKHLGLYFSG